MKAAVFRTQYLLLPFVVFFLVPGMIVRSNAGELTHLAWVTWLVFLILALFSFGLLQAIGAILSRYSSEKIFSRIIEFGLFFVVITGFFLPASTGIGMMDAHLFEINPKNILLASVLSLLLTLIAAKYKDKIYPILLIYIALNTVLVIPSVFANVESQSKTDDIFNLSRTKNILVLSFDGVPGPVMAEVLRGSEEDASVLQGFEYFERVASSSPATSMSTLASLLGNRDFSKFATTEDELWSQSHDELVTTRLIDTGYLVSAYGVYGAALKDKRLVYKQFVTRYETGGFGVLNMALARMFSSAYTIRGDLKKPFIWLFNELFRGAELRDKEFLIKAANSLAPEWKRKLTPTFLDYHEYVDNLRVSAERPVAHFLHFTFSHFPVEFDGACQLYGYDKVWFVEHQNRDGVLDEARCVIGMIDAFITKLTALGALDNSLIVIKSDHGKPVKYGASLSLEAQKIRGHELWGLGRYLPMLAIRQFGAGEQPLVFNQRPVMLDDLARTICLTVIPDKGCEQYAGFDLLSRDFTGIEEGTVTMFIVKNAASDYRFQTHDALHIKRGNHAVESMAATLDIQQ